jgi:hypothetical protein
MGRFGKTRREMGKIGGKTCEDLMEMMGIWKIGQRNKRNWIELTNNLEKTTKISRNLTKSGQISLKNDWNQESFTGREEILTGNEKNDMEK